MHLLPPQPHLSEKCCHDKWMFNKSWVQKKDSFFSESTCFLIFRSKSCEWKCQLFFIETGERFGTDLLSTVRKFLFHAQTFCTSQISLKSHKLKKLWDTFFVDEKIFKKKITVFFTFTAADRPFFPWSEISARRPGFYTRS